MFVKVIVLLLFILEVLNIFSYTLYRAKAGGKADFLIKKKAKQGEKMTYCLPGIQADPRESFKFLEYLTLQRPDLMPGGITYIRYNNRGFDPEQIARQIAKNIKKFEYEPYLISISIGDQIARLVEQKVDNVKIIAINPATNADSLVLENLFILQTKLVFMNILATFGGWLGNLKTIYTDDGYRQSISLYLDCLNCLAKSELQVSSKATTGLVISCYDSILDNRETILNFSYLKEDQVALVDTGHANTITGGVLYAEKMEQLLQNFYSPKDA